MWRESFLLLPKHLICVEVTLNALIHKKVDRKLSFIKNAKCLKWTNWIVWSELYYESKEQNKLLKHEYWSLISLNQRWNRMERRSNEYLLWKYTFESKLCRVCIQKYITSIWYRARPYHLFHVIEIECDLSKENIAT